ncbi:hypothetical protein ABUE38_08865 [Pediococcus parvulus]
MIEQLKKVKMCVNASQLGNIEHYIKTPFNLFQDTFGLSLTSANIGIVFVVLLILRFFIKKKNTWMLRGDKFIIAGVLIAIFSTNIIPWEQLLDYTGLAFIQYPLRLNTFSTLFLAVGSTLYVYAFIKEHQNIGSFATQKYVLSFVTLILFLNFSTIFSITSVARKPQETIVNRVTSINSMEIGQGAEYLPVGTRTGKLGSKVETSNGKIKKIERNLNSFDVDYVAAGNDKKGKIVFPLIYYPGYKATQNGKYLTIYRSDNHQIKVYPKKSGTIHVWYAGTKIQKYSSLVSILTLLVFGFALLYYIFSSVFSRGKSCK